MKGYFFIVFFLIFTSAMFLISQPMFPGDNIIAMAKVTSEHTPLLSALINGIVYGLVAWAIFAVATRKIENASSKKSTKNPKKRK